MATVYFCLKAVLDTGLPVNEGLHRVVRVIAPKGSVVKAPHMFQDIARQCGT
jgi:N-methylhydantoinase B/oxoprolinase/acetone carboxylase alpha subunit